VHRVHEDEGKLQVLVECLQRFRIERIVSRKPPFSARVTYMPEPPARAEVKAYAMAVINTIKELLPLNPLYVEELRMFLDRFGPDDPSHLADFAASLTTSTKEQLQEVLEAVPLLKRMEKVLVLLNNELELARAQQKIRASVEERMHKQQREFFLREQLKAIQKELGIAKDDRTAEVDKFKDRLKKLTLTEEAQKRVDEEMDKLAMLETGSPEYAVTRNYLDWITLLPWGQHSKDKLDLKRARRVLDRDHYGLDDVKERILEFLAVGIHKGEIAGSIILLVGPPGVGKTSIGRSIADALGRRFYRFSVGGIRDEAEIKGHRRTYIGAMPGKFIQAMKDAGTANPVIMLDEIDKIGASYHGDPASALLEVLDPEQNVDFLDHYLDLRFDLSKVLFVCTANQTDSIPGPLLDRMEVIQLSGYIADEKLAIAKKLPAAAPDRARRAGQGRGQGRHQDPARADRGLCPRRRRAAAGKAARQDRAQGRRQAAGGRGDPDQPSPRRAQGLPGQPGVPRRAQALRPRRGHRPGLDRDGRRHAVHRGRAHPRVQPRLQAHRPTRRRDEGVRRDRLRLRRQPRRRVRRRSELLREGLHPPARARRRHAQGRPVRRHHHGLGAAVAGLARSPCGASP
jgi:ATP-dependent Lon protease